MSDVSETHPVCDAFIAACEQAGLPRTDDFNGKSQEGAGYFQLTTRNGRRWSTARGYLKPARRRPNLRVVSSALTTRILFEGRRAVGVEYTQGGATQRARANAEVILAGGAFNSPQLLQLSGVGPADLLRQHGIAVIADMPGVGADLQDHYQARFNYRCSERVTMNDMMNSLTGRVAAGLRYALFRKGFLTVGAGYAGGFFKTDPSLPTPDVQFHFILFSADAVGQKLHPWPGFLASICQLRPESRGFVRIKSADPAQAPAIQPRYMSAPHDRDVMTKGMQLLAPRDAPAGAGALHRRGAGAGAEGRDRRGAARIRPPEGHDRIPPDLDLPHGLGRHRRGGRATARARLPGLACRRRLDHADRRLRQHQRGLHHDRRKSLRHDPAGRATAKAPAAAAA